MTLLQAMVLGAVQGVTEFLPISSDGHLVIAAHFFASGLQGRDALGFDILLHFGSLLAILIGFSDVWTTLLRGMWTRDRAAWRMAGLIVVATIPGVIAGLWLQDIVANELRTLTAAAVGLLVTAGCLMGGEYVGRWRASRALGMLDAILIGVAQAAAILPGVSRSGLTVSTARARGIDRTSALDFSFLMAMPIIAGAIVKTGLDMQHGAVAFPSVFVASMGFGASFVVSVLAIAFLRRFVRHTSFAWFAWYLVPLALLLIGEDLGVRMWLAADHAREAVRSIGAAAVFLFALIEVVPPFSFVSPGIIALIVAGSLSPDLLSLFAFMLAASIGSVVGNASLYCLGVFAGPSIKRALRLHEPTTRKAESAVRRFGLWAIIGGQFVGPLRPTISFVAGVLGMHPGAFAIGAFCGAALWGMIAVGTGYLLRAHVEVAIPVVVASGVLTMAGFGLFLVVQWMRTSRIARSKEAPRNTLA